VAPAERRGATARPARAGLDRLALSGAHGTFGIDLGDTLCYSAATGDLDADGRTDLSVNDRVGNGLASDAVDAGKLPILGPAIASPLSPGGRDHRPSRAESGISSARAPSRHDVYSVAASPQAGTCVTFRRRIEEERQ
jgi:hypothetical protein